MGYNSKGTTFTKPQFTYIKDKKIAIYQSEIIEDAIGQQIQKWLPLVDKKVWACYRHLTGNERQTSKTAGFDEECYFTVNWRSDIKPGMHVVYRDKVYEVISVDDFEGYKKDIKLSCKTVPNFKLSDYTEA